MSASPPAALSGHHLILGGCGFIGRAVAVALATKGENVVLADRIPPAKPLPEGLPGQIIYRPFDLATADWGRVIEGAAVIHHYAWTSLPASANADPGRDLDENLIPTLRLLDTLRQGDHPRPRIIFASSGGTVYGRLQCIPVPEEHPLRPITAYGVGKAAAELYLHQYSSLHNIDCRIARIANPFGAGQNLSRGQGAVTTFIHHALAGTAIDIWGDGEVTRDYIHISDVADCLVKIAEASLKPEPRTFNVGSGKGVSLNGVVAALEIQLDRRLDVRRGTHRVFDVPVSVLDVSLAAALLDWRPRLSFQEGLAVTIRDMLAHSA